MILAFASLLFAALLLARYFDSLRRVEAVLVGCTSFATLVVLLAYLLSLRHALGSAAGWIGLSLGALLLISLPLFLRSPLRRRCLRFGFPAWRAPGWRSVPWRRTDAVALSALGGVTFLVGIVNLLFILRLEPATLDVLKYHLARVGYFLQHGSLQYYAPNHWAQIVHPKVSSILMLYVYRLTGREALASLVQYAAYWVGMLAVYGIARESGAGRRSGAFAGLVFGLLTICIAEASSAQNDLLLTACAGCVLYALLRYRCSGERRALLLASVAFALGLGVKLSFLTLLPSLALVALWPWRGASRHRPAPERRHTVFGAACLLAAVCLIALPAGYLDNVRHFGHPAGPWQVRVLHSFERRPPARILGLGTENLLRYKSDFMQLDGLGPVPGSRTVQSWLVALPRSLWSALHLDLANGTDIRGSFHYVRNLYASENTSSWGVLGLLLVWPVVLLRLLRPTSPAVRSLAAAAILYVVVQAYSGPYDSWRGRYFIAGALFAAPCLGSLALPPRRAWVRIYLLAAIGLGCLSALMSASFRQDTFLLPVGAPDDPFRRAFAAEKTPQLTRIKQLVRQVPSLANPLVRYESLVPPGAVVALDVSKPLPEYLFFGEHFSRRLVPLFPFGGNDLPVPRSYTDSPHLPLPVDADYLLCTPDSPHHLPSDLPLYQDDPNFGSLYLRKLR